MCAGDLALLGESIEILEKKLLAKPGIGGGA